MNKIAKRNCCLIGLLMISLGVLVFAPLLGMEHISIYNYFNSQNDTINHNILWNLRLPRVCFSFLCGIAMALSGMAFQAIFRNPLATPFTLGVASGASLGAALYIQLGLSFALLGISGISFFAFFGALMSVLLVYKLTLIKKGFNTSTLLLAGVAVSFFFSSIILFVQYLSGIANSFQIVRWTMGTVDVAGYTEIKNILPFILLGSFIIIAVSRDLNLMMTGEDIAKSRGTNVKRIRKTIFITASFLIGSVVAFCGPIGFVGMMVPHIARLLIGAEHRYLSIACILLGGSFLALCDTFARTVAAPAEIPVGIITALLGGPFFLWLLLHQKGSLEV